MNRHLPLGCLTAAGFALSIGLTGCDVDQTQEGRLPDVDVEVSAGQMPKYDVDTMDVDVGTKKVVVTVPDVNVTMPEDDDPMDRD